MGKVVGGGPRSGVGRVMADGGGSARCGVPILRDLLSENVGRDPTEGKTDEVEEAGGEYAWGLYPFCSMGFSVSNMSAILM